MLDGPGETKASDDKGAEVGSRLFPCESLRNNTTGNTNRTVIGRSYDIGTRAPQYAGLSLWSLAYSQVHVNN